MKRRIRELLAEKLELRVPEAAELLTVREVGNFLRVSKDALRMWRKKGEGPIFFQFAGGRIRYPWWGIAVYIAQRLHGAIPASKEK